MANIGWRLVALLALVLVPLGLLGSADDGGCGGIGTPEQACLDTGGTWGETGHWPPECGSSTGNASIGSVCTCPSSKPNWRNGEGCIVCPTKPAEQPKPQPQPQPKPTGRCVGSATPCEYFWVGENDWSICMNQTGCYAWTPTMSCRGTPSSCAGYTEQDGCGRHAGCYWLPGAQTTQPTGGCIGRPYPCESFWVGENDWSICMNQKGCYAWTPTMSCRGTPSGCSGFSSPETCTNQTGCYWNGSW